MSGFAINALSILFFNYSRPFISVPPYTSEIKLSDNRPKKYFSRFLKYHDDYTAVSEQIVVNNFKNIGLMFGDYDLEYQLFRETYQKDIKSIHLNSSSISESIPVVGDVDCIVSTNPVESILYEGETYYNATINGDGYLSLFLKKWFKKTEVLLSDSFRGEYA